MIIVSQNKISVINFDNVTTIEVNKYNDKKYVIKAYLASARMIDLAIYETEERADEVLEEIIEQYEHEKDCKCDRGYLQTLDNFTYRMPKN